MIRAYRGLSQKKHITFYPPVDANKFRPQTELTFQKIHNGQQNDADQDKPNIVIGTLGNFAFQKGHDDFVRVAQQLSTRLP